MVCDRCALSYCNPSALAALELVQRGVHSSDTEALRYTPDLSRSANSVLSTAEHSKEATKWARLCCFTGSFFAQISYSVLFSALI